MSFVIEMVETQEQPALVLKTITPVSELLKILGKAFMDIGFPVSKALPGKGDILAGSIPAGKQDQG